MALPILCVGALTLDTIFSVAELPPGPGKFIPQAAVEIAAGMASTAATAIVRLGGTAALWASVGTDATGKRLISEIAAEGVDCAAVRQVEDARSAFATILVDQSGERIIVPYYDGKLLEEPNASPTISSEKLAAVMVDVRWPKAAARALAAARSAGIPAVLDADVARPETLDLLLPLATHIVASDVAAQQITGEARPATAVERLAERYESFVAVTAGGDGVYWFDAKNGVFRHCPAPKVVVRDTLAAGDVFHGAFALGLAEGMPMDRIVAFATTAAAMKCEVFGGRLGAPSRAEVEVRMQK
ncbi:PfkB family carbohydrate kinase [uncultured Devosia sp.]|uniref:PfkB family carbohydrate kinase n=1 Tax=uncultured Devosia sp. TaxID=211434 RepID=UPI0035CCA3A0